MSEISKYDWRGYQPWGNFGDGKWRLASGTNTGGRPNYQNSIVEPASTLAELYERMLKYDTAKHLHDAASLRRLIEDARPVDLDLMLPSVDDVEARGQIDIDDDLARLPAFTLHVGLHVQRDPTGHRMVFMTTADGKMTITIARANPWPSLTNHKLMLLIRPEMPPFECAADAFFWLKEHP